MNKKDESSVEEIFEESKLSLSEILNDKGKLITIKMFSVLFLIILLVAFAFGIWQNLINDFETVLNARLTIGILSFVALFSIIMARIVTEEKAVYDEYENNKEWQELENNINKIKFNDSEDDKIIEFVDFYNDKEQLNANRLKSQSKIRKIKEKIRLYKFNKKDTTRLENKLAKLQTNYKRAKIKYISYNDIINLNDNNKIEKSFGANKLDKKVNSKWYEHFKLIDVFKFVMPVANGIVAFSWLSIGDALIYLSYLLVIIFVSSLTQYMFKRINIKNDYIPKRQNRFKLKQEAKNYTQKPVNEVEIIEASGDFANLTHLEAIEKIKTMEDN